MEKKALLLVDVQNAFYDSTWGERNNPDAEENISRLVKTWRKKDWPVIYIQHVSDNPSSLFYSKGTGVEIKDMVKPLENEKIIKKKVNSSFIGTDLERYLRTNGLSTVVITGLTTPHCVSTTTRMSGNLGFDTYLISDAVAAFGITDHTNTYYDAETIHTHSLAALHDEFAVILSTEQLLNDIY
nr:cysteine hydrolase family protein [Sinobaca sp. H24]